jgi:adenylate kinase family enzyme
MEDRFPLADEATGLRSGAKRIHVMGASGSGTTTLARALAERFGLAFFDVDNFFWQPADPPFQYARERPERQKMLADAVTKADRWVLAGSLCGWGDVVVPLFDLVVFVVTATDARLARLRERESGRFGVRIAPGGDMHTQHIEFLEWAASYDTGSLDMRSLRRHEDWLRHLSCPVLRVGGSGCPDDLCIKVATFR